jgi:hypothetical protein
MVDETKQIVHTDIASISIPSLDTFAWCRGFKNYNVHSFGLNMDLDFVQNTLQNKYFFWSKGRISI